MSKELEALDKIAYSYGYDENILIINKSLKALEIIKENCEFDFLEKKLNDMPSEYEIHIRPKNKEQLLFTCLAIYPKTEKEFNLLKEVLL